MTLKLFETLALGSRVDFGFIVTDLPREGVLGGVFLAMDEAQPFSAYHRTNTRIEASWNSSTRMIMGTADELVVGALLRVVGKRQESYTVNAEQIIVLTQVARVIS